MKKIKRKDIRDSLNECGFIEKIFFHEISILDKEVLCNIDPDNDHQMRKIVTEEQGKIVELTEYLQFKIEVTCRLT